MVEVWSPRVSSFRDRVVAFTVLLTLAFGALSMLATPSWAACSLIATTPQPDGSDVISTAGRGTTCTGTVSWVTGYLKHQKIGPDSILDTETRNNVGNSTWTLRADCLASGAVYYTEVRSSTGALSYSSTNQACG